MIFKTFDNDIDKWTAKIGIFGKSFNELGTAVNDAFKSVIDNLDNFDEDVSFWESLKNNLFSKKNKDKDWNKNLIGEIISKENIDSYINELDLDSAKEKLQRIFDWQEDIKNNDKTWQDYFDTCKGGNEYLIDLIKNTDDLSKLTGEDLVKANQQARASAIAHNEAIKAQTLSAKAGSVALKALSIAGNMLVMWAISECLKLVVNWIDQMIHSAEYAEKAFKAATDSTKSFSDAIKNTKKDTADMESSVKSIAKRYAELSQGVNSFTNENISLSLDDYEEFLDLNEQLAGLFPSLTKDYDDNGKSILGLSGSVDSVTESIKALVEQEKELARASIRENLEQYFDGTDEADGAWRALEGRKKELEEVNKELDSLSSVYKNLINSDGEVTFGSSGIVASDIKKAAYIEYIKNIFGEDIANAIKDADSNQLYDPYQTDVTIDFSKLELTETQKAQITKSYETFYSELLAKQKTAISEFDSQISEFSNNAMSWLEDLSFYKESDPYVQTAIRNLVSGIDWSTYDPEDLDYAGVKRILQDSILTPFQVACDDPNSKEKLTEAFKNLFTLNLSDMSVNDISTQIDSYVNTIASIFGVDPLELKIKLGFEDVTDVSQRLQNSLYQLSGDHGIHRVIDAELIEVTSGFTQAQVELWLEATRGATNATQAIEMYKDALAEIKNTKPISLFDQLTNSQESLDKFQSSVKSAFDSYSTLLSGNYSSSELLDSIQAISQTAKDMDKTINWELIENMNSSGAYDSIEVLGSAIEYISEEYAKSVLSDAGIDVDSKFGQMLANNIIQAQKASTQLEVLNDQIDSLQSSYSNLTDIVETYNETGYITFDQLQTLLEMEPQYLSCLIDENGQLQLNEAAMAELANKRLDEAEAQAIQQAITELGQIALQDEKQAVQENAEAFTNAIDDLANYNNELANTMAEATVGASAIRDLNAAINDAEARGATDDQINTVLNNLETKLQLIKNVRDKVTSDGLGSVVKSGSNSSSSEDTHKANYEKELQELENAHDMGLHSDEEYWEARIDLNEKYFGELSGMHQKYLDEYRDAEEAILGGIKNLWKDYYDQRKSELKDLISYAQELYDKEIDSLDASIEKLEERRDTEKMYWQNQIDDLDDEIDALQDANDEKQRAIDLQNKQYQLQKAMHQRTMLIYSESQGLHYVTDDKAVRDAKNDLDDAENDNKIEGLKKQQKDLQKQLDTILETYDSQIESIEKQIDSLNKVKSAWSEIVNNQELKELEERLKSIFGDDVKEKILSNNTDYINGIISQYSDTSEILKTIEDATLTDIQNMVSQYGVLPENLMYALNESIPNVTSNIDEIAEAAIIAASEVSSVADAINNIPESKDVTISIHTVNDDSGTMAPRVLQAANLGNAYASGTKRAQKGIAVVGEEKPEVVITNNKKVLLAEHPTLLNMEGGETVFDGDETEKMLKARGLRRITPDELPLLKALTQYNSSEITQRFTPNITSPANAILSSTMQNASHAVTNNSAIQPSYTMGDVHIHCPGITKDEVVKQIGTELTNVFSGMSLKAYQRANITR